MNSQWPEKLNVLAGILCDTIISPLFIDCNLNGDNSLNLPQENPQMKQKETVENLVDEKGILFGDNSVIHFQNDGAPPHYSVNVCNLLYDNFPDK